MAFAAARDVNASRYEGAATAREARALGVNWIFAPDADVNNNPDNPIINIRSYGENPQVVARHAEAFIEGAESDRRSRILTTAKHFPGHGDTATDTHLGLATITAERGPVFTCCAVCAAGTSATFTLDLASDFAPDVPSLVERFASSRMRSTRSPR